MQPSSDALTYSLIGKMISLLCSLSLGNDEAPHSDAGQDVNVFLPTDWVLLDGRGSTDDRGIVRYEWTLLKGDPLVNMKVFYS